MREYEIWIGYYSLGQGYSKPIEASLIGKESSIDFKTACLKYILKRKLERIESGEIKCDLNSQDYHFFYNPSTMICDWNGQYFPTKDEAEKTFRRYYVKFVVGSDEPIYTQLRVDGKYDQRGQYTLQETWRINELKVLHPISDGQTMEEYEIFIKEKLKEEM